MPTTPYAKLLVSLNAGAPTSGGIQTTSGVAVQLTGESTVGWTQQRFEISDYPVGFAQPAGWSTDPVTGAYFYALGATPPPFTPAVWGKYMLKLTVNGGLTDGAVDVTLTDTSSALSIPSPNVGLLDLGFGESLQFSALKLWTGDLKKNLRTIEAFVGGGVLNALVLGSQTPPQYQAVVGTGQTIVTGTPSQQVESIAVPVGKTVSFDLCINGGCALATPGCVLPIVLVVSFAFANAGTGPLGFLAQSDTIRTSLPAGFNGLFTISASGNNLVVTVAPFTPPAFVSSGVYGGSLQGTFPNASIAGASLVTNDSGKLYVCTVGNTDSGSAGPTGTGPGDIHVGGVTWRYVGPAGTPVAFSYTVTLLGIKTQ